MVWVSDPQELWESQFQILCLSIQTHHTVAQKHAGGVFQVCQVQLKAFYLLPEKKKPKHFMDDDMQNYIIISLRQVLWAFAP